VHRRIAPLGLVVLCLGAVSGLGLPPLPPPAIVATVDQVVDGVTVEVRVDRLPSPAPAGLAVGQTVRVRYLGVAAPAGTSPEAPLARALNAALVAGKTVYLELDAQERGPDGTLVAYVYLDPDGRVMVNLVLLATDLFTAAAEPAPVRYVDVFAHAAATPGAGSTAQARCAPAVPWNEARSQIGNTLCVEGPVMSVGTSKGGDVFLNLGLAFPDPGRFALFIPARHVGKFEAAFGTRFWTQLVGKTVQAQGEVKLYRGVAEIILTEPGDLFLQR